MRSSKNNKISNLYKMNNPRLLGFLVWLTLLLFITIIPFLIAIFVILITIIVIWWEPETKGNKPITFNIPEIVDKPGKTVVDKIFDIPKDCQNVDIKTFKKKMKCTDFATKIMLFARSDIRYKDNEISIEDKDSQINQLLNAIYNTNKDKKTIKYSEIDKQYLDKIFIPNLD